MRLLLTAGLAFGGALLLSSSHSRAAEPPAITPPPGYKLVWHDEFDKDGAPDPEKWGYEDGFIRNGEPQFYTTDRRENARVEGGHLVIEGRKEHFKNPHFNPKAAPKPGVDNQSTEYAGYTAASLITLKRASWTYGRIEVRAKLPHGKGMWPAIWMLGDTRGKIGWPGCGEIDIMEFVGKQPDKVHATVHWRADGKHKSSGKNLTVTKPWEDFHVYAVDWTAEKMDFYYDQTKYASVPLKATEDKGESAFTKPQYLLLNLALGGSWGGPIDDSVLPQQFQIDYVRVFQQNLPAAP